MTASTYVGHDIDLEKLAKSALGAVYNPKINPNFVNYRTRDGFGIGVLKTGKVVYIGAGSEAEARSIVQKAVAELNERKIPSPSTLQITIDSVSAIAFFRRGIDIQALPHRVHDSLYVRKTGDFLQGTYNKGGTVLQLTSGDEVLRAVREVSGGMGTSPLASKNASHFGYCKLPSAHPNTTNMAQMVRGDDKEGNMLMTGFSEIEGAKNEAEARESAAALGRMLEGGGVFGPLTPLERVPGGGKEYPKLFDYFADDPGVWAQDTGARGFAKGYVAPILVPAGFVLPQRICYNCSRRPVFHDGLYWVESDWWKPFKEGSTLFVNLGNPPQTVWICPECARCVVCGVKGTKEAPLRSQSLLHEKRIPTVVAYCKDHDALRTQSIGVSKKKVPKELKEAWSRYLAYQAERLSSLNTPSSRERLDEVKALVKEYR